MGHRSVTTVVHTWMVPTERGRRWASTMEGYPEAATVRSAAPPGTTLRLAHRDSTARLRPPATAQEEPPDRPGAAAPGLAEPALLDRAAREELEDRLFAPLATRAAGSGRRVAAEEPDRWRTCFERDRDRVLHSTAFRRLAGKTQVFVFPEDHQRTRLTHALEVAQVAGAVARSCRLNVALTEAIALGHDCGHGPGGHASEDALDPFLPEGFDHAPWGAEVSLARLNLCAETLDGIRNHSWSRPAPSTPEGEVVSWADRIAYVCHDWEDAARAGVVRDTDLPDSVLHRCGTGRGSQLGVLIEALVEASVRTGRVGMDRDDAEALSDFRARNYERVYLREESLTQASAVVAVLRALVGYYGDRPAAMAWSDGEVVPASGSPAAVRAAVTYVAGMTDRFAFRQAVERLGWDRAKLPRGVDEG